MIQPLRDETNVTSGAAHALRIVGADDEQAGQYQFLACEWAHALHGVP